MSQADLSFNGLIGVMEAVVETVKRFQEFEDRYRANDAAFQRIQQQFQQMQEGAVQLQSLAEERLTSLAALNVELKARHAQGEQTLAELRSLLDEIRAQQARFDQELVSITSHTQIHSEKTAQTEQTVGVLQALAEKLQERQSHLEQSLLALETLIKDQGKQFGSPEGLAELRSSTEQVAERQAQVEKALAAFQATQQAEKGLITHFEKALNNVRTMTVELERRQAQTEISLAAIKATGTDANQINQQTMSSVAELMKDIGERQSAMMAMIEEARQTATQSAAQVAQVTQQIAGIEKKGAQAVEAAEAARALAAEAAEKAAALPKEQLPGPALGPEDQQKVYAEFKQFLARCEADHKAALDRDAKVQAQARKVLDGLPARAEAAFNKFLEQSQSRLDPAASAWARQQETRLTEVEERHNGVLNQVIEKQMALEKEFRSLSASAPHQKLTAEWIQAVEGSCSTHTSELRFLKTLLWITLAAVGLSYALVAYALILRA